MKSKRQQDTANSYEIEKFLDRYLYKEGCERVKDVGRQLKGIDVIYKGFLIDEKCALDYINKDLKTFSFEISSVNRRGERYDGWLVNKNLDTTHYLLCYINKCKVSKNPKVEDIEEVEVILISKKSVLDYLDEKFGDITNLKKRAMEVEGSSFIEGLKIIKSSNKAESPINILLRKGVLRSLSVLNKIVRYDHS